MDRNVTPDQVIAALTGAFGPPRTYPLFAAWSFGPNPPPGLRPLNVWVPLARRGGMCEAWIFPRDGGHLVSRTRADLCTPRDIGDLIAAVRAAREVDLSAPGGRGRGEAR